MTTVTLDTESAEWLRVLQGNAVSQRLMTALHRAVDEPASGNLGGRLTR